MTGGQTTGRARPVIALFALLVLGLAGCAALEERREAAAPPTIIGGTVKSVKGRPLPGLALLERNERHGPAWSLGGLITDGRFRLRVPDGGQYQVHVYASGYFRRSQAVKIERGQTLTLDLLLAPEPTRDRDPIIRRVAFEGAVVTLDVADPDEDLGPHVMAFNAATGRAHPMKPPVPVTDPQANFPGGVYRLALNGPANPRDWYFVVADRAGWTSDILAHPHEPTPAQAVVE